MLSSLLLAALASSPAHAFEFGVGGYVGHYALPADAFMSSAYMYGLRVRARPNEHFGIELEGGKVGDAWDPRAELMYFFSAGQAVTPFVAAGGGALVGDGVTYALADLGGGLDAELLKVMDFRVDARYRMVAADTVTSGLHFTAGLQFHNARQNDKDGDGVADRDDKCRDQAEDRDGYADEDGCPDPDNDNDGVNDLTDACPVAPEDKDAFADADGCPDPDNDGDGVADADDQCATNPEDRDGYADTDGCPDPDNDGDGIVDASDKCVAEPETKNNFRDGDGCPDEIPQAVQKFSGRIEGIKFKTNSAVIEKSSFAVLDEAVGMLKQYPELRLEVQGHTDDVGDDAKNLKLSQDRAQSVVDYMVKQGVESARLVAHGYGETRPVAPNEGEPGRALNRRVEFQRLQ